LYESDCCSCAKIRTDVVLVSGRIKNLSAIVRLAGVPGAVEKSSSFTWPPVEEPITK
jgi:hypothetical protein